MFRAAIASQVTLMIPSDAKENVTASFVLAWVVLVGLR
jgi:hypothetical protein